MFLHTFNYFSIKDSYNFKYVETIKQKYTFNYFSIKSSYNFIYDSVDEIFIDDVDNIITAERQEISIEENRQIIYKERDSISTMPSDKILKNNKINHINIVKNDIYFKIIDRFITIINNDRALYVNLLKNIKIINNNVLFNAIDKELFEKINLLKFETIKKNIDIKNNCIQLQEIDRIIFISFYDRYIDFLETKGINIFNDKQMELISKNQLSISKVKLFNNNNKEINIKDNKKTMNDIFKTINLINNISFIDNRVKNIDIDSIKHFENITEKNLLINAFNKYMNYTLQFKFFLTISIIDSYVVRNEFINTYKKTVLAKERKDIKVVNFTNTIDELESVDIFNTDSNKIIDELETLDTRIDNNSYYIDELEELDLVNIDYNRDLHEVIDLNINKIDYRRLIDEVESLEIKNIDNTMMQTLDSDNENNILNLFINNLVNLKELKHVYTFIDKVINDFDLQSVDMIIDDYVTKKSLAFTDIVIEAMINSMNTMPTKLVVTDMINSKDKETLDLLIETFNIIGDKIPSELLIKKDIEAMNMYKRGWFLRATLPSDLIQLPNMDYYYINNPVKVDEYYKDWDVYYWKHNISTTVDVHPLDFGNELGSEHVEVSIEIMVDIINMVLFLWAKFYIAFTGLHGVGAIKSFVIVLFNWLTLESSIEEMKLLGSYDDYMRCFRWIRWESEAMCHKAREDYSLNGNYWIELLTKELFRYMWKHHVNKIPLFRNVAKMDMMRDIFRDAQSDIDIVLDKVKADRFYLLESGQEFYG